MQRRRIRLRAPVTAPKNPTTTCPFPPEPLSALDETRGYQKTVADKTAI